jgi:hypothetical protein
MQTRVKAVRREIWTQDNRDSEADEDVSSDHQFTAW